MQSLLQHRLAQPFTPYIESVRNDIAGGTYETPDKLDAAIDRILDLHDETDGHAVNVTPLTTADTFRVKELVEAWVDSHTHAPLAFTRRFGESFVPTHHRQGEWID